MKTFLILCAVLALTVASPLDKDGGHAAEDVELLERRDPDYPAEPDSFGPQGPGYRGDDGDRRPQDDFPFGFGFGFRPDFGAPARGFRDIFEWLNNMFQRPMRFPAMPSGGPGGFFGFDDSDEKDFDNLPADYDNSTYNTKVVNGSLVAINETIKRHKTNNTNFFYHVKTVQVLPQNASVVSPTNPDVTPGKESEQPAPVLPTDETSKPTNQESNDVNTGRHVR